VAAWRDGGNRGEREAVSGERDTTHITIVRDPNALNWQRGIITGASMISALILLAIIAVLVLTGTDWGRERVRRFAEVRVNGMIHGRARIGRLSGNLLTGLTVHDFVITDSAGKPFVAVESFRADYSIMGLLRKHIWLDNAVVVRPLIVLDRPVNENWNWQRIFPRDTTPKPPSQQVGWGDWLRFTNAAVVNGQLIVRTPWHPSEGLKTQAARDSAIRSVLGGGSRLMVQRAGAGYQKTVQLDSVTAAIPLLRLSEPGFKDRLLEVSSMTMKAYPFRPPAAEVRDLKGVFPFNNDSIWWQNAVVSLPHSRANGSGSYAFGTGDMTMQAHSDPASFADMRWVYPRLPEGHGKLDLGLKWRGPLQDYQFSNADVVMGEAHATGSFGITLADTATIHNTNMRFTGVDTRTLEQLIPHFKSPRRGVFAGRAIVSGGRHALAVNTDLTFDDQRAGTSRVTAIGGIGFLDNGGVRASNLRLGMMPLQVDMARTWDPTLPIGGVLSGTATVNGSTNNALAIAMNVNHTDRGEHSALTGRANVSLAGGKRFEVDLTTHPVSLVEVGRFFPAAGLQGWASGPVHLTGTLADLRLQAELGLPEGGHLTTRGTLDLASKEKAYDLAMTLHTVNLRTVEAKAPITSLTAVASIRGRGTSLPTMNATLAADMSTSRWDSVAVDTISVRATLANGLATIPKLYAHGAHTDANVSGSFGLTRERSGQLTYRLATDSLGAFNRWIPRQPGSSTPVQPRPRVVANAVKKARADSARVAKATELERVLSGRPGPTLAVNMPKPVPADTLSGELDAAGTLRGNIYDFDLHGAAGGKNVVARGNFVKQFQAIYDWQNVRTPQSKLALGLDAAGVSAMGFAFDTVNARLTYASPGGHVELAVIQGNNREYSANGDYALYPDRRELRLADMRFRFDTAYWALSRPTLIAWGGPGIRVNDLELRNRGNGRIYANGLLPTNGVADFRLDVDNFPVANVMDLVQSDVDLTGVITLHGTMAGTMASPAFRGAYGVVQATYNGTAVPDLRGTFGYADRLLVTHAEAIRNNGTPMTVVDARLPLNLALSGVTGPRLLPDPMAVDVVADSLPLELVPQFTDIVSNVKGHAAGKFAMRGTLSRPSLVGAVAMTDGAMTLNATGAAFESINASLRMANDTVYVDSIAGWARGDVRVRGTLAVGNWREPSFNLFLQSNGARLMNNDKANIRVDAGLALTGPFRSSYLSGAATIVQGVIYAPEPTGRHVVSAGDPALFNVLDTAIIGDRQLFPPASPLLANMRVDVNLGIRHNTWVRNREANIEVYTDDPLIIHEESQALAITGIITTDRGEYSFLSKRFQITRGSAMFIGSPDINPTLQITGEYQVVVASRGALNVRVLIGGTMKKPTLSLESDAQPPKTQSELLSLLAFGQSSTTLLGSGSSSIAGSAATLDLFGVGAQVAVRRLEATALGVAVDQVQIQAGKAFGTDVFDITPADVPQASGQGIGNFITNTKFEAGKYINGRTYVSAQEQAMRLGLGIDHRTADGWRFTASFEPRIVLLEPTLKDQPFRTQRTLGGFILREWRF
jgi:translocation and assembly module TamB